MRKLQLNMFLCEVVLVLNRGGQPSETVAGHAALITETIQSKQVRVVAHGPVLVIRARENEPSLPC
jgi:hypothetical protein